MLYGLRKKVSCPPSTVLHFEFSKNTRRTYGLKLNALLIFRNSQGSCSENVTWQRATKDIDEAFVKFSSCWDLNATTVISYGD